MTAYWILLLITAFVAYVIGSMKSMVIASNFVFRRSLSRLGTGNVWFSNFRRIYGVPGFIKLGLVEVLKDLLPLLIGGWLLGIKDHAIVGRAFAGFCMVLGGLYPVFYDFKGGHATVYMIIAALSVDTSLGVATGAITAAVTWFSKYESLGTIAGALVMIAAGILVVDDRTAMLLCVGIAVLVLFKHIPAMIRLLGGREQKFSLEEDISYKFDEKF